MIDSIPQTKPPRHAIADLLAHPDRKHLELVNGRLIERGLGAWGSVAATKLLCALGNHNSTERRGWLFDGTLAYRCFADTERVRHISGSFITRARLPRLNNEPFATIPPDFILEMTPPFLNPDEVPGRIDDFLAAGTRLAWVANYQRRTVLVRRPGEPDELFRAPQTITGGDVLPGFAMRVAELFPPQFAPVPPSGETIE